MNRRQLLQRAGVAALALGASRLPFGWTAPADGSKKRILMYTRSQAFQHSVVKRGKDGSCHWPRRPSPTSAPSTASRWYARRTAASSRRRISIRSTALSSRRPAT